MAEVFGIAAGAAGFASLLIQVISGIDTLREICHCADKAPAELTSLINDLTFLKHLMEQVKGRALCRDEFVIQHCHASCEGVVIGLEKLKKSIPTESEGRGKQKILKIFAFRHWKEDVETLNRSIQGAKINLILVIAFKNSVQLEEFRLVNLLHILPPQASCSTGNLHKALPLPPTAASSVPDTPISDRRTIGYIRPPKLKRHMNCAERYCTCSCHHTVRTARRFWALEYTPLSIFRQTCDNKDCDATKYGGKFSLALSQLGIRWSVIVQLHILAAPGKFLFRPNFELERIVPYTSPGFEALWRCQNHLITVGEARDRLFELYHSDPSFKDHVNPGGKSYIEELVRAPWGCPASISNQYELLKLLLGEFGMTRGTQSVAFLAHCAKWIGEGPHLELLEILLELGFDATLIDSPHAQEWPQPSSPNWIAEGLAPDPFFVEYQRMLLKDNQGFANMTPLHEAVLFCSLESVNEWISRSDKNERNFLGQTPIHLATSKLSHLLALVDAGHDLDAADNYGITPLMYAAAANHDACFMALLEAGANLYLQDTRYRRTFMNYAAIRNHWSLIFKSLCWIEAMTEREVGESWARYATILYYVVYPDYLEQREVSLQQLLAKCGSVHFIFDDYDKRLQKNSLLHYVRSVKDVEILLELGFSLVNHVNSNGQHALISATLSQCKPDIVRRLLSAGAEINLKDNFHHTALYYSLNELQNNDENTCWAAVEVVRILLASGADILVRDYCRCPCSPSGCFPSAVLPHSVCETWVSACGPFWSLEWLGIVLEHRGIGEAKTMILSFIRRAKFDEMGMTHVCCSHERCPYSSLLFQKPSRSDEDIDEILEEESQFVEILENEMAVSSAKVYEALLEEWILQIKASLEKSCEEAVKHNNDLTCNKAINQTTYSVDYKKDYFTMNLGCFPKGKHPVSEVIADAARYIYWIEHEYHFGGTSSLDIEKSHKDDWYFRRYSWLHRMVSVLEISRAEITESMRNMRISNIEIKHRPIDVEESINHFLQSWETWETRRFALVDEVETQLGK